MAIDVEEVIQKTEDAVNETVAIVEQPVKDGWSVALDEVLAGDYSGISTAFAILVGLILLKPLIFFAQYIVGFVIILMIVKYYV